MDEVMERQLRALLDAQTALRKRAEEIARQARAALERVAEALCPEAVDRIRQGSPSGLASMTPDQIADMVIREVGARIRRLELLGASSADLERTLEEARSQVERLRAENARLRRELDQERAARQAAETRAAALERMMERRPVLAAPLPPTAPPPPAIPRGGPESDGAEEAEEMAGKGASEGTLSIPPLAIPIQQLPSWIREWAGSPYFERDRITLWVLGSTGVARRMEASIMVGQAFGVEPGSGSVTRAFERLKKLGLLEVVEAQLEGKKPWHLFRLTEKGTDTFRLLFGQDPAPSQTDLLLARHKSPEHVLLILLTADLLAAAGWTADPLPDPVLLPAGERYEPDILAIGPEGRVYIECERQTVKDPEERSGKWRRAFQASGGDLIISVPDRRAMEAIRSEVLFWLGTHGIKRFRLRMIVLEEATPENLFQYVREMSG
ncbi:MAG: hypothetical protein QN194_15105 [Armatimonadota bacterium]|nr:hypothetical protein [Armatimonadota bacterium]